MSQNGFIDDACRGGPGRHASCFAVPLPDAGAPGTGRSREQKARRRATLPPGADLCQIQAEVGAVGQGSGKSTLLQLIYQERAARELSTGSRVFVGDNGQPLVVSAA
ncbi:MAG: hypothetical protein KQH59_02635 [Desulfobulbaceae bacterium]|nr:hypothetical protein [Desulfobulbaceae bacterium]